MAARDTKRQLLWVIVVGFAALTIFGGVLSTAAVSEVAHASIISTGLDMGDNVVLGAAGILLTLVSGWCGMHFEHLLRHRYSAFGRGTTSPRPVSHRWPKHHGPASTTLALAVYLVFIALLVPGVVSGYHDSEHSSDTQHSGVRRDGEVQQIVYIDQFFVRSGARYPNYLYSTSKSLVGLDSPVLGHRSVTLHYPSSYENPGSTFAVGTNQVGVGRTVDVLVDPKDPVYAEFPGFPVVGSSAWTVPLLFVLVVCAPLVSFAKSLRRQFKHGRAHRTASAAFRER